MHKNSEFSPTHSDLISVVIPMFNSAEWIRETLVSVFEQDYRFIEILIVNDGSTDTSLREVERVASEYPGVDLKVINIPNSGVSFARNLGIKHSRGRYVALLDSDDIWAPNKLSVQVEFLEKNQNCIGVLCDFFISFSKENGTDLRNVRLISNKDNKSLGQNWLNLEGNGALLSSTVLLNRNSFIDFSSFDSELSTTADLHFYLQLISKGEIGQLNLPLVQYRQHGHQMHSNPDHLKREIPLLLSKLESLGTPFEESRITANMLVMCCVLNLRRGQYAASAIDFFNALRLRPLSTIQIPYKIIQKRFFGYIELKCLGNG